MLFLFANLPSNSNLPAATVAACQRICNEWQHYVIRAHVLQKSFLSIKGIYYQAEVQGQDILWLVPYKFAQNIPVDVDFRIMGTFVEFYTTLLGFVMFKLYTNEGLVYPPKFDEEADARGAGLRAFQLENKGVGQVPAAIEAQSKHQQRILQKRIATLDSKISNIDQEDDSAPVPEVNKDENSNDMDTFEPIKTDASVDVLAQPHATITDSDGQTSGLFSKWTVFLSRETPREPLEFILRSFGCKRIGWDAVLGDGAFTENELDTSITHQLVDRPPQTQPAVVDGEEASAIAARGRVAGRTYIQPQYVWDCINANRIIPPAEYAPGALLPPHLSPWVKVGAYDPTAPLPEDEEMADEEVEGDDNGMTEDLEEGDVEMEDDVEEEDEEDQEESEDEEEVARRLHQKELEAEVAGVKAPVEPKKKSKKSKAQREEEEQKEMQKIMMTKKKRKLYEKMMYGNKKKEVEADTLVQKRRKLEKEKKKASA